MKPLLVAALAAAAVAVPAAARAQGVHDHAAMSPQSAQPAKAAAAAEGEVRKVDRAKGTVTLKHGPLEALNMPPMTMVFVAADPKMLAGVKEGDKVRFIPAQGKDGQLVVTQIDVVK